MQAAGAAVAVGFAAEPARQAIAIAGDPAVQRTPQKHAAGKIHERHGPPQTTKTSRQVAHGFGAPVAVAAGVDDAHFLHHPLVGQVGPALGHLRVVQRQIREFALAVPPGQLADLGSANATVAVEDHHVGVGTLFGAGKFVGHDDTDHNTAFCSAF